MRRLTLLVLCGLIVSCEPPLAVPAHATLFIPDRELYLGWWREVEACSGLRGDFDSVQFFVIPGSNAFRWNGALVKGVWFERDNRIYLTETSAADPRLVRHEMLHAIIKLPGHPDAYFKGPCDAIID